MIEDGPQPAVGVYALRTFRVRADGVLLPLMSAGDEWAGGTCVALCSRHHAHHPPEDSCTCGVYGARSLAHLRRQYTQAQHLVAVVELSGSVIEGTRGYRAQLARVVALWIGDRTLPPTVRQRLLAQLPDVATFTDEHAMIDAHPGVAADDASWTHTGRDQVETGIYAAGFFAFAVAPFLLLGVGVNLAVAAVLSPENTGSVAKAVTRTRDTMSQIVGGTNPLQMPHAGLVSALLVTVAVLVLAAVKRSWGPARGLVWTATAAVTGLAAADSLPNPFLAPLGLNPQPWWVIACAAGLLGLSLTRARRRPAVGPWAALHSPTWPLLEPVPRRPKTL